MSIQSAVGNLTEAVDKLTATTNVPASTLTTKVSNIQADQATAEATQTTAEGHVTTADGHVTDAQGYLTTTKSGATYDASELAPLEETLNGGTVNSVFIYDTRFDSDGGAWRKRTQHTSWYNETLASGKWLGVHSLESDARNAYATVGSEEIPNPDFATDVSNWTPAYTSNTTTVSHSALYGGSALLTADAAGSSVRIDTGTGGSLTANGTYRYIINYVVETDATSGYAILKLRLKDNTHTLKQLWYYHNGAEFTQEAVITASGAGTSLYIELQSISMTVPIKVYIKSISVKEVTGQTTVAGDYFQSSSNGLFYSLNAGSGTTRIHRGHRADFPSKAVVIGYTDRVAIYDADDPTLPMWMEAYRIGSNWSWISYHTDAALIDARMVNGVLAIGTSTNGGNTGRAGITRADFIADEAIRIRASAGSPLGTIAERNISSADTNTLDDVRIYNGDIVSLDIGVRENAPIDPKSGLPKPTIAVGVTGGFNIIQHDDTVTLDTTLNWTNTANEVRLSGELFTITSGGNHLYMGKTADGQAGQAFYTSGLPQTRYPLYWITPAQIDFRDNRLCWFGNGITEWYPVTDTVNTNPHPHTMVRVADGQINSGWCPPNTRLMLGMSNESATLTPFSVEYDLTIYADQAAAEADGWVFELGTDTGNAITVNSSGFSFTCNGSGNGTPYCYKEVSTTLEAGAWYQISTVVTQSGAQGRTAFQNPVTYQTMGTLIIGSSTALAKATDATMYLRLGATNGTNGTAVFTSSSVKAALPNWSQDAIPFGGGAIVELPGATSPVDTGNDICGFNGTFSLAHNANWNWLTTATNDYTIMWWGTCIRSIGWAPTIAKDHWFGSNNALFWGAINSRVTLGSAAFSTAPLLPNDEISFICFVNRGGTVTAYINGKPVGQQTQTQTAAAEQLVINGRNANDLSGVADGGGWEDLALMRISTKAISDNHVDFIYNSERPLFAPGAKAIIPNGNNSYHQLLTGRGGSIDPVTGKLHFTHVGGQATFNGLVREELTGVQDQPGGQLAVVDNLVVKA